MEIDLQSKRLTLALCMGANTAIFSVVCALLLVHYVASMLFPVRPTDPWVCVMASHLLAAVAAAAFGALTNIVSPEIHRKVALKAMAQGESLNEFVTETLAQS